MRWPAPAPSRDTSSSRLERETFGQGARELSSLAKIFRVIAGLLAGGGGVQTVVDVVVPLRVALDLAFGPRASQCALVSSFSRTRWI